MEQSFLQVKTDLSIEAHNGGLFVSRGQGIHPDRQIATHELIFVRQGVLEIQEDERCFKVCAGQALLLWPGRRHRGIAPYPKDLSFYWLHFTPKSASRKTAQNLLIAQHVRVCRPDHMTELFRRFLHDQETGALEPVSAGLLAMLMLCELARVPRPAGASDCASGRLAGRADTYIRTHFHDQITPNNLAEALGCNANYLSRVFHQVYGQTLTEAIHRRRLQHARQMLMEDDRNIDEIAYACGFQDVGYFRRLFKREEGLTPLAFRRLYSRIHTNTT